jgi:nucleoside-diphosphate-sugar epimerase
VNRAVHSAQPEVVINQLTSLPQTVNPLAVKRGFDLTSRLRREVSGTLVAAARAAGARRIIAQSISFAYRPGPGVRTESDPLWTEAKGQIGVLTTSLATLESVSLGDAGLEGVVLRYGSFYGAGTYFAPGGLYANLLGKRRLPLPGDGGGLFGMVHIEDAAMATTAALEGPTGTFNIVDDVPAPASEWMPFVARLLGAKPPRHVPSWLARMVAGQGMVMMADGSRGASNAKAKRELGWTLRYPSWRRGFAAAYGQYSSRSPVTGSTRSS